MAETAEKIVENNGLKNKINIIKKHSKDVTTGKGN